MTPSPIQLLSLTWDRASAALRFDLNVYIAVALIVVAVAVLAWKIFRGQISFKNFEIDQAEIGVGSQKFRFKPNLTDRQVAYAIWVELSTRKIGLPIDLSHDVIVEIYDSWYNFFSVTRDLVKSIPVSQVKSKSTQAIIKLSIEVLNEGLRPHLTRWQARFRRWYERELDRYNKLEDQSVLDPQEIQAKFPQYDELKADLERVNVALMKYRAKMRELVLTD